MILIYKINNKSKNNINKKGRKQIVHTVYISNISYIAYSSILINTYQRIF